MTFKLLAIDMDGTLLFSKHGISDRVIKAVKEASRKGIKIVISTGRIYTSAKYYGKLLETQAAIISCNGAFIKEYCKDEIIYKCPIDDEDLIKVLSILDTYKEAYYQMYGKEVYYAKEINDISTKYYDWNKNQNIEDRINIKVIGSASNLLKYNDDIYKVFLSENYIDKNTYDNINKEINQIDGVYSVVSISKSLDIINKKVSKGNALKILSEYYEIPRENIISIGDNHNDVEMIKFAGLGIAMGNAEEAVKDIADYITDTNINDGVAKAIEKFI